MASGLVSVMSARAKGRCPPLQTLSRASSDAHIHTPHRPSAKQAVTHTDTHTHTLYNTQCPRFVDLFKNAHQPHTHTHHTHTHTHSHSHTHTRCDVLQHSICTFSPTYAIMPCWSPLHHLSAGRSFRTKQVLVVLFLFPSSVQNLINRIWFGTETGAKPVQTCLLPPIRTTQLVSGQIKNGSDVEDNPT